jgi:3-oxoacyl-(acyl-carrier-protein) synthase III
MSASQPPRLSLPVSILGTQSVLPGRQVTTREVFDLLGRPGSAARWETRVCIRTRHWVEPGTLITPYAAAALRGALDEAGLEASELRRIILVYSGVGDLMFPATANGVAAALGLRGSCDAFDVKNACMGFLTGLDLAARSVATGLGPVGIAVADFNSRGIRPSDYRPFLVFGDAAASAVVGAGRPGEGIVASFLANDGSRSPDVFALEPTVTGQREYIQFGPSADEIATIAIGAMRRGLEGLLDRAEVELRDIEWVIPHQPNPSMVDAMIDGLGLDGSRVLRVAEDIGSVASSSIPVALDRLRKTRRVKPGDRILMLGVGGGISYGGTLYRVGAP